MAQKMSFLDCFSSTALKTFIMRTRQFYRATSDGSFAYKSQQLAGSNKPVDHMTVLLCCNATGTDKWKFLVM